MGRLNHHAVDNDDVCVCYTATSTRGCINHKLVVLQLLALNATYIVSVAIIDNFYAIPSCPTYLNRFSESFWFPFSILPPPIIGRLSPLYLYVAFAPHILSRRRIMSTWTSPIPIIHHPPPASLCCSTLRPKLCACVCCRFPHTIAPPLCIPRTAPRYL